MKLNPSNRRMEERSELSGGEAVVEALESEEVDLIFGLPGISVLQIYDALYFSSEIRPITVKHEASAAIMADMCGRLTGSPGVCLTIAGPGATNAVTAVAQAYDAASPMVHISGVELGGGRYEYFHAVDEPDFLRRIFEPITKWSYRIERVKEIPNALAKAFGTARSGRTGPVHVEIPWEVLEAEDHVERYVKQTIPKMEPDGDLIGALVKVLSTAESPLLLVGKSVLRCFASKEIMDLAEILAAPIVSTTFEPSVVPTNHPLYAGMIEYYVSAKSIDYFATNPIIENLFKEADMLICVGLRLGTPESELLKQSTASRIVHLDVEENKFSSEYDIYMEVVAHLKSLLQRLNTALRGRINITKRHDLMHTIDDSKKLRGEKLESIVSQQGDWKPIHPAFAINRLRKALEEDALVVSDIGMCQAWLRDYFEVYTPNSLIDPGCYGSMGFALPASIAAKMIYPDRQVAAVVGDGAFLMSLAEFHTAVENELNIIVVVLNDSKYNSIWQVQKLKYGGRFIATDIGPSNFYRYAEVYGAKSVRVTEPSALKRAYEEALSSNGPTIVEILTDYEASLIRYEAFARHLK